MADSTDTRQESDSLETVDVPADAYYGAFTVRAQDNFQITGNTTHPALVRALGQVKKAAAIANHELGDMDAETRDAIVQAADAVIAGEHTDQFVLDPVQAGAGTPVHMNANEVIANRATEILGGEKGDYTVDPHDDVNMGQSSNNVVPTATRIATISLTHRLLEQLELLAEAFDGKADEYADTVKVGRTHLQDAVPITLGQEFAAYASMIRNGMVRMEDALDELHVVGIGSNAIGTGINTEETFREKLVEHLSDVTEHNLTAADHPIAVTQSMAPFARFSGALRTLVTDLNKIANDLVLMTSGPNAGLHEIALPEVEPGSSIMPGKVNPSIVEAFKMTCYDVLGKDQAISMAAKEGQLELNVMTPLIAKNLFEALTELANATEMLREQCVTGIEANENRIQDLFDGSTVTATALSPYLGYDTTAEVVQKALESGTSIRDIVVDDGLMEEADVEQVLDVDNMTKPGGLDAELVETYRD
jgi:aspartate ammonia-lyase